MLYRIWYYDYNDRREVARVKSSDFDKVVQFLKNHFIEPKYLDDVHETDYGISWSDSTPQECFEIRDLDEDVTIDDICFNCGIDCTVGFHAEELEEPDLDDFEYKTIYGTNEYYDLDDPKETEKTKVYNEFLNNAWMKSPQLGVSALIVNTIRENPELEKGFSKELIEKSKKDLGLTDS